MNSSQNSVSVFSLKFGASGDDFEIIPETSRNYNPTGFQDEFYNSVVNSVAESSEPASLNNAEHSCPKCDKKYKYTTLLGNHVKTCEGRKRHREIIHICSTCNKTYKSTMAYRKHVLQCFQSNSSPCLLDRTMCFCCEEPIKNGHLGDIKCLNCTKSFQTKNGLTRHLMLLHASTKSFKCEMCNAQCSNKYILKLHRQSHNDEIDRIERSSPEYKCNECDKSFLERTAFDIHIASHNRKDIHTFITYKCKICNVELPTVEAFQTHLCVDIKKTRFRCDLCGKYLSSQGFLHRHINTHKKYNQSSEEISLEDFEVSNDMREANVANILIKEEIKEELLDTDIDIIQQNFDNSDGPNIKEELMTIFGIETNSSDIRILNGCTTSVVCQKGSHNEVDGRKSEIDLAILKNLKQNDLDECNNIPMDETALKESIISFLKILLDSSLLEQFGWPTASVDKVLTNVLRHLNYTPSTQQDDIAVRLRENVKLLFEAVADDTALVKNIENIQAVDNVLRDIIKNNA